MTKHTRRMLALAATAAATTLVAGPAMASDPPAPQPEILESEPPPVESTEAVTGPYQWDFGPAFLYALAYPHAQPQAVNDFSCVPREGTQPVILVHGTYANQYDSFARMAPDLAEAGHCVYSFNYGVDGTDGAAQLPGRYGTTGLSGNADELGAFAATVRERTGADEVDMIGWSQGGTLINDYVKDVGGDLVDDAITYGATHHGTTASGIALLARSLVGSTGTEALVGQAAIDQTQGSAYLQQLNAEGDTVPGVDYTVVATEYDAISTPYDATFLEAGPGASVDNITLQDGCSIDHSGHLSLMYSARAIDIAKRALDPQGEGWLRCHYETPLP